MAGRRELEDGEDKYWRNLGLNNNYRISTLAFDTLETANDVKALLRNYPQKPTKKQRQQLNQMGTLMVARYDLLFHSTRAHLEKSKLAPEEKLTITNAGDYLERRWGSYDVDGLIQNLRNYYDMLVRTNMVPLSHGYEAETLEAKLNKW